MRQRGGVTSGTLSRAMSRLHDRVGVQLGAGQSLDEADAQHGPAALTGERRERGLGITERRDELRAVGRADLAPAVRASHLVGMEGRARGVDIGEAGSLLPAHVCPSPASPRSRLTGHPPVAVGVAAGAGTIGTTMSSPNRVERGTASRKRMIPSAIARATRS